MAISYKLSPINLRKQPLFSLHSTYSYIYDKRLFEYLGDFKIYIKMKFNIECAILS